MSLLVNKNTRSEVSAFSVACEVTVSSSTLPWKSWDLSFGVRVIKYMYIFYSMAWMPHGDDTTVGIMEDLSMWSLDIEHWVFSVHRLSNSEILNWWKKIHIHTLPRHSIQHFPSVDHQWKGTLSASAPLACYISRYHRIHARQWPIGGCDTHDTEVS